MTKRQRGERQTTHLIDRPSPMGDCKLREGGQSQPGSGGPRCSCGSWEVRQALLAALATEGPKDRALESVETGRAESETAIGDNADDQCLSDKARAMQDGSGALSAPSAGSSLTGKAGDDIWRTVLHWGNEYAGARRELTEIRIVMEIEGPDTTYKLDEYASLSKRAEHCRAKIRAALRTEAGDGDARELEQLLETFWNEANVTDSAWGRGGNAQRKPEWSELLAKWAKLLASRPEGETVAWGAMDEEGRVVLAEVNVHVARERCGAFNRNIRPARLVGLAALNYDSPLGEDLVEYVRAASRTTERDEYAKPAEGDGDARERKAFEAGWYWANRFVTSPGLAAPEVGEMKPVAWLVERSDGNVKRDVTLQYPGSVEFLTRAGWKDVRITELVALHPPEPAQEPEPPSVAQLYRDRPPTDPPAKEPGCTCWLGWDPKGDCPLHGGPGIHALTVAPAKEPCPRCHKFQCGGPITGKSACYPSESVSRPTDPPAEHETAWLVERPGDNSPEWLDRWGGWTPDANKAHRHHQEDAAVIQARYEGAFASEHVFLTPAEE